MVIILSEKVLQTQICSVCKKYLSYGPVKLYPAGVKCGRCISESDQGPNSKYNQIAFNIVFPCVNRYESCQQLLKYQQVPEHEKICLGGKFSCPICPDEKYPSDSLLCLQNHYRIFHKSEYITRPFFFIGTDSLKDNVYMYCHDSENLLFFIYVQLNTNKLYINVCIVRQQPENIKYKIRLLVNGLQKYESSVQLCSTLTSNFSNIEIDIHEIRQYASIILCKLDEFDTIEALNCKVITEITQVRTKKIKVNRKNTVDSEKNIVESYGISLKDNYKNPGFFKKMPGLYLTQEFINTYGKFIKIRNGDVCGLQDVKKVVYNTVCKFCENYLSTSRNYQQIYFCPHISAICGACFHKGLNTCQFGCKLILETVAKHYKLLYFCRFGCKKFFKGGELSIHERLCELNQRRQLTNFDLAKVYFGDHFIESSETRQSVVVRGNIVVFNSNSFGRQGQIYIITDYNFQCIILYEIDENFYRFHAKHEYSPDKYYILFKLVKSNTVCKEEEINSFSISVNAAENLFFAVIIKHI